MERAMVSAETRGTRWRPPTPNDPRRSRSCWAGRPARIPRVLAAGRVRSQQTVLHRVSTAGYSRRWRCGGDVSCAIDQSGIASRSPPTNPAASSGRPPTVNDLGRLSPATSTPVGRLSVEAGRVPSTSLAPSVMLAQRGRGRQVPRHGGPQPSLTVPVETPGPRLSTRPSSRSSRAAVPAPTCGWSARVSHCPL